MKWLILIVTIWLSHVAAAQSRIPAKELRIAVSVTPNTCVEPCSIRIDVVVPPRPENRWAVLQVDGPEFRSSSIQLNGEVAAKRHTRTYEGFGEGDYKITAVLYDSVHEVSRSVTTLLVR